jgi:hypothetical protein
VNVPDFVMDTDMIQFVILMGSQTEYPPLRTLKYYFDGGASQKVKCIRPGKTQNCALNFGRKLALLTGGREGQIRRTQQNMLRHAFFSDE